MFLQKNCAFCHQGTTNSICEATLYFPFHIHYEYFKKGKKITLRHGTYQV